MLNNTQRHQILKQHILTKDKHEGINKSCDATKMVEGTKSCNATNNPFDNGTGLPACQTTQNKPCGKEK